MALRYCPPVPVPVRMGVVVLVLASGCAFLDRDRDDPFAPGERDGPVTLQVQNDNFNDARIYAFWNGQRERVGRVTGKTSESFDLRWRSHELRVRVDFLAAGEFTTEPMSVWPGENVHLWIPASP